MNFVVIAILWIVRPSQPLGCMSVASAGILNANGSSMTPPITILVVEDEPLVSMALVDDLEAYGFIVLEASNAAAAVKLLESRDDIRVIITDVDMPGSMDGLMLAAAVADRWPPIRIIVVSGYRNVEITDIPDGSVFYSKPYKSDDIIGSMNEMLS
jgi:CheY-like chemotaxis protein